MAAEHELALPQVPEARPDDAEDVSWSLSTAEAMWARGDHLEGIKWVRKAAEAASEVENDARALELAKAASDLATLVARRSRASIDGPTLAGSPPQGMYAPRPASAPPVSALPSRPRSHAPPAPPAPARAASSAPPPHPPPLPRSSPPGPLASMAGQPRRPSLPGGAAPRPPAASEARHAPLQGRPVLPSRVAAERPKTRRRSRENLDQEARAAGVANVNANANANVNANANANVNETAPLRAIDPTAAERAIRAVDPLEQTAALSVAAANRAKRRMRSDPTVVARHGDLHPHRERSAAEWDTSPTANLTGDDMEQMSSGDRQTAFAVPMPAPEVPPVVLPSVRPAPLPAVHDPAIQTTQAVRVVVWRDANGVHVAPAGTIVSAITIDAVLVVLEEGADLTAWLSQRER